MHKLFDSKEFAFLTPRVGPYCCADKIDLGFVSTLITVKLYLRWTATNPALSILHSWIEMPRR